MRFTNLLFDKVESKFISQHLWSDASKTMQNCRHDFEFTITPVESEIYNQAKLFTRYFVAEGYFTNSFLDNSQRLNQVIYSIEKTYVYSYVKAVYYGSFQALAPGTVSTYPKNNPVFLGHKMLFDYLIEGFMTQFSGPTATINVQISELEEIQSAIKEFSVFKDNLQNDGSIFNSEYETILNYMKTKCSDSVKIDIIGNESLVHDKMMSSPLGNSCLSSDLSTIYFIEDKKSVTNTISMFWGKACLITALIIPSVDINDNIYDDIPFNRYDLFNISHEVQSITGYNPFRKHAPIPTITAPRGSNPIAGKPKIGTPEGSPNKQSNNKKNKDGGILNKVVKMTSNTINLFKDTKRVLDDENVKVIANVLANLLGNNIGPRNLKKFLGYTIENVLAEFGIPVLPEATDEYSAFYLENHGNNDIKLVSYPKLMASSSKT